MSIWELFLIAVALSMDAFAVSICKGLSAGKARWRDMLITGGYFGGFQALMPLLGYLLGTQFQGLITRFDHWIAFGLLSLIGINMIRESFGQEEDCNASFCFKTMLPLALATSIDALAVGITFAFLQVHIFSAVLLIGSVTFLLSAAGVKVGSVFGSKYKARAERLGGAALLLIGIKILLEHLGMIAF